MSDHWNHYNPVKIAAGIDVFSKLGQQLTTGKWLLVTTAGTIRRGLADQITAQMPADTELLICDQVTPNPELDHLDELTRQYRSKSLTGLIALGGGSAMDAAKVLSVTLKDERDAPLAASLRDEQGQSWTTNLPVIAIPTTSGTGAEVTPFATVWDQADHKKYSITGDGVYPLMALLDPKLTLSLPHDETLYTALDAISHALESLWNKNRTPVSEAWAWQALELANDALPKVLAEPQNLSAREQMQQSSLLAGLAISQTRTAIAHSISYPLTSHYGVPHGLACSFTLPTLIKNNFEDLAGGNHTILLSRILNLLQTLGMDARISNYLTIKNALALTVEMTTPERAGNYSHSIDIRKTLYQSLPVKKY